MDWTLEMFSPLHHQMAEVVKPCGYINRPIKSNFRGISSPSKAHEEFKRHVRWHPFRDGSLFKQTAPEIFNSCWNKLILGRFHLEVDLVPSVGVKIQRLSFIHIGTWLYLYP